MTLSLYSSMAEKAFKDLIAFFDKNVPVIDISQDLQEEQGEVE